MKKLRSITVQITEEMLEVIEGGIESGDYIDESDVVRDALRGWIMAQMEGMGERVMDMMGDDNAMAEMTERFNLLLSAPAEKPARKSKKA